MKNFKPPFRIAPKNKCVVQDANKKTVATFYPEAEELAAEYVAFINKEYKGMLNNEDIKKII
ncbi:hypothetical protein OZ664_11765 [Elizabethkingia sp. HX WHF]|uniref:Uncharacterized protein n=1 Tax=Elizabethkingia miricola TaxID=172045 RepID=A0ABY3NAN8_ELIMR|nr:MULTISPECIES: hypothetical protein [Elizabethkingia]MDX8564677.1 hypothetical protein [Elizabethkingia sp. HX WHF]OBS12779.1 hypothetical protein ATE49_15520 [Elizabethkingia miricola]TYO83105.1 hypothetical protein LX74_04076 [Elizabethkingia miricola]